MSKILVCKFQACLRVVHARGYCVGHYSQQLLGKPLCALKLPKVKCSFPGCKKKHCAKGLCNTHWAQQQRHGHLMPIRTHEAQESRWLRQVSKSPEIDGCWIFIGNGKGSGKGASQGKGYGQFRYGKRKWMAHRFSYEKYVGPISEGMQVDHLCRNTFCVNPKHLEIVTGHENMRRLRSHRNLEAKIKLLERFIKSLGYEIDAALKIRR